MNAKDKGSLIMVTGSIAIGALISSAVWGSFLSLSQNKVKNLQRQSDYWKGTAEYYQAKVATIESIVAQLNSQIEYLESQPPAIEFVEVEVPVPVEIPTYVEPRHFQSLAELEDWVNDWTFYREEYPWYMFGDSPYDCDDFSIVMVSDAALDGYILGLVVDTERHHALVCAVIGNDIVFIEPQSKEIMTVYQGERWIVDK